MEEFAPSGPTLQRRRGARFRWTAVAIGLLCGALSALLGISAGLLMVPLCMLLLRLNRAEATATSLAAILAITSAGALTYHLAGRAHGEVVWGVQAVLMVAVGEVVGALVGVRLAPPLRTGWPRRMLGVALIASSVWVAVRIGSAPHVPRPEAQRAVAQLLAAGFFAGVFSSVAGIGGDVLVPGLLVLLLGFTQRLAQGLSLAVIPLASLLGTLLHLARGNVSGGMVGWLALGGMVGSALVAQQVFRLPQEVLMGLYGTALLVVGLNVILLTRNTKKTEEEGGP